MSLDEKTFQFFADRLGQVDDLFAAFEDFKRELGQRFCETLSRRVQQELRTGDWTFCGDSSYGSEIDIAGVRIGGIRVVIGTYRSYPFPFEKVWVGVGSDPNENDLRIRLQDPVREALAQSRLQPVVQENDWIAWANYRDWPVVQCPSDLRQFIPENSGPLMDKIISQLSCLKDAVTPFLAEGTR